MKPMNNNRLVKARGFSLIELLIVVAIILIIAAIGVPSLLRARMLANETAAVAAMRNIRNSEATYVTAYATAGYANTLAKLGPGSPCDQNGACLVDELIGCKTEPCPKSGYTFSLKSETAAAPYLDFAATATPLALGSSGRNNYCVPDDGIIRQQLNPVASIAPVSRATCSDATQFTVVQ
ncbi:MAG: prepilin-type N-terminal cleavage/methylation domain-containing protein [Acidobacteriia bacterium]|nr:prepilin-type N-terminal cleavage/methylation domain-containing protein [Terriglobia bacterium]